MKTSIVLCTYNGERYLQEQLDSIASQTVLPDEILVSDDASTDGTVNIVKSFIDQNSHLYVSLSCNTSNLGYVRNFSNAVSHASGDICFLCDQDDIWEPEKIEVFLRSFIGRSEVALVFSDLKLVDDAGMNLNTTFRNEYPVARKHRRNIRSYSLQGPLLRYNLITGASMAFRPSLLPIVHPIPSGIPHDYWIALIAASRAGGILSLENAYTRYRIHANQAIGLGLSSHAQEREGYNWIKLDNYYSEQIHIWKTLLKRVRLVADQSYLLKVKKKIHHARLNRFHALRRRKARSENLGRGFGLILEEAIHMRYKYSRGLFSFARDLRDIFFASEKSQEK